MPLFSEHISNMYYSGSPSYSSSYGYNSSLSPIGTSYSASYLNPGGSYSSHSSLGGYSRPPLTSRWIPGVGRCYAPMLSTISERSTASPCRINSPRRIPLSKRNYSSSGYTSRPININTADIDVSRDKYKQSKVEETPASSQVQNETRIEEKENGPFMPRVDGKPETGIDSSPGTQRSTIKRGRTVVRLHTLKRKERDSPRKPVQQLQNTVPSSEKSDKTADAPLESDNIDNRESLSWRQRLSDDLIYKDKKVKKTLGTKLVEKFALKDNSLEKSELDSSKKPVIEDCISSVNDNVTSATAPGTCILSDRRCSMELLAEQAKLLDSLIRNENLSTTTLDVSKVGITNVGKSSSNFPFGDNAFENKRNSLKTAKSDHSLHQNLKSIIENNDMKKKSSKRRSLKKSLSGGNICRLDSITEFPKEPIKLDLPPIKENLQNKVIKKPRLKTKITSTVEVTTPQTPLKFIVENVIVEEKVHPTKKDIIFTSEVEETPTHTIKLEKRKPKENAEKLVKFVKDEPAPTSPDPDDGNFWNKIGKRETVYLMKRKKNLDDIKEQNKRALFWFPEEEEEEEASNIEIEDRAHLLESRTSNKSNENKIEENANPAIVMAASDKLEKSKLGQNLNTNILGSNVDSLQGDVKELLTKRENTALSNFIKTSAQETDTSVVVNLEKVKKEDQKSKSESKAREQIDIVKNKEKLSKSKSENDKLAWTRNKTECININQIDKVKESNIEDKIPKIEPAQTNSSEDQNEILCHTSDKLEQKKESSPPKVISNFETDLKITNTTTNLDGGNVPISEVNRQLKLTETAPEPLMESDKSAMNKEIRTKSKKIDEVLSINEKCKCSTEEKPVSESISSTQKLASHIQSKIKTDDGLESQETKKKNIISSKKESKSKEEQNTTAVANKETKSSKDQTPDTSKKKKIIKVSKSNKASQEKKVVKTMDADKNYCKQEEKSESVKSKSKSIDSKDQKPGGVESVLKTNVEFPVDQKPLKRSSLNSSVTSDNKKDVIDSKSETSDEIITDNNSIVNEKNSTTDVPVIPIVLKSEDIPIKETHVIPSTSKDIPEKVEEAITNIKSTQEEKNLPTEDKKSSKDKSDKGIVQPPVLPTPKKPVKVEAALRPLIATPRPLQKKPPQIIHSSDSSDSSSEEDSSDDDSESETSEESEEFIECEVNVDGRTSTGSNDSGFDSSAPTSPALFSQIKKEQSTAYDIFRKTGRFTPPARSIPRFRKYTIEDFHFIKVLGKGSFGKVLLAELRDTEYYYAVKCLKKDVVLEDDDVECTLIERKVLALGTNHPYLCHLFATFQTDSHLFFVMEYLNGGDLMFHIQQSGRFPEPRARFYGAEIVSGLKFLHKRGIIYRDLKLDNILLDFEGHVRIADFGMCKLQIYLDKTADTFCGTPDYMAPEIIKGLKYNQTVDWWSFGVLLYEMLIGQSPFSGCDEDELFWSICNEMPSYPRFLSKQSLSILTRLLDKDARMRLGGAECMHGDIREQEFFNAIHWDRLERRELEAPFRPRVRHPMDTQYFDRAFTGERPRLTAVEPQVLRSMDQEPFRGFSYTNPNATDR